MGIKFLSEAIDDKVKQVLFLYLVVCLLGLHTFTKQTLSLKPNVIDWQLQSQELA